MQLRNFQRLTVFAFYLLAAMKNGYADSLDTKAIKALLAETRALRTEVAQLKKELAAHKSEHRLTAVKKQQIGTRFDNSRIYLDQGFMTIGNLKKFDFYASIGQMYVPFGQYNSYLINSPLTASLFTTSERPVLGYSHKFANSELDAAAYF